MTERERIAAEIEELATALRHAHAEGMREAASFLDDQVEIEAVYFAKALREKANALEGQ